MSLTDRLTVNHETVQDETSSNGNKDDEDDDDDESDDKIDTQKHDPERLKSFNVSQILFTTLHQSKIDYFNRDKRLWKCRRIR